MITDDEMYPAPALVRLPITLDVMLDQGTAERVPDGVRLRPPGPGVEARPLEMTLGGHPIGTYVIDALETTYRDGPDPLYLATLRRVDR
jgi:hypothetical protein